MTRPMRLLHLMLLWICIACVPQGAASQERCKGSITFILSGDTIDMPLSTVSMKFSPVISVQAFGTTTAPCSCSVVLSLSFGPDGKELDPRHCTFRCTRTFSDGGQRYFSCDFGDVLFLLVESGKSGADAWEPVTASSHIQLSKRELQNGFMSLAGDFAGRRTFSRSLDHAEKTVELAEGKFFLQYSEETSEAFATAYVPKSDPVSPALKIPRTLYSYDSAPAAQISEEPLNILVSVTSLFDQIFRIISFVEELSNRESAPPPPKSDHREVRTGRSTSRPVQKESVLNSTRRTQGARRNDRQD